MSGRRGGLTVCTCGSTTSWRPCRRGRGPHGTAGLRHKAIPACLVRGWLPEASEAAKARTPRPRVEAHCGAQVARIPKAQRGQNCSTLHPHADIVLLDLFRSLE